MDSDDMAAGDPHADNLGDEALVDSDDTTSADLGLVGGSGAAQDEAAVSPQATAPLDDDGEHDDERNERG